MSKVQEVLEKIKESFDIVLEPFFKKFQEDLAVKNEINLAKK
jgi:hypothetical protein